MKHIDTTHVGSLPRSNELAAMLIARDKGEPVDPAAFDALVQSEIENAVAKQVGFQAHHGNVLEIEDGALTGKVKPPILDKHAKVECLRTYMDRFNLKPKDCLTIGDGANDIPMLKTAGLGIGYKPKPAVANQIDNLIIHGDLSAALYAQGFTDSDFYLT